MVVEHRTLTIKVDMNALKGDELGALVSHASDPIAAMIDPPHVGDLVETIDEEGDRCVAMIIAIHGDFLRLRMDWSTWRSAVHFEPTSHAHPGTSFRMDSFEAAFQNWEPPQ